MNTFNLTLPPGDKSLSHVSLNSKTTLCSWKSSCTMFVLCEAAINESRRTAALDT